jgi:hypothetical protein
MLMLLLLLLLLLLTFLLLWDPSAMEEVGHVDVVVAAAVAAPDDAIGISVAM